MGRSMQFLSTAAVAVRESLCLLSERARNARACQFLSLFLLLNDVYCFDRKHKFMAVTSRQMSLVVSCRRRFPLPDPLQLI